MHIFVHICNRQLIANFEFACVDLVEALRMIDAGAVKLDGEKISDKALQLKAGVVVAQVGKRKFGRVTIS